MVHVESYTLDKGEMMALTKEALEKAEREATASAVRQVETALQRLADSLHVVCSIVRPTERPVWVVELNPPEAGTGRSILYKAPAVQKAKGKRHAG